jgi:ATP-dependent DNA helicase RecG
VLAYIEKHGSIKRAEAAELCRISLFQATRLLKRLTEGDKIAPKCKGKGIVYKQRS